MRRLRFTRERSRERPRFADDSTVLEHAKPSDGPPVRRARRRPFRSDLRAKGLLEQVRRPDGVLAWRDVGRLQFPGAEVVVVCDV